MSFLSGGGGSGTTVQSVTPYAPAQPALNQILANAGYLYQQGGALVGSQVLPSIFSSLSAGQGAAYGGIGGLGLGLLGLL